MKNDIKYYEISGVEELIRRGFRITSLSDANYKTRIGVTLSNGFFSQISYVSDDDLCKLISLASPGTRYNFLYH